MKLAFNIVGGILVLLGIFVALEGASIISVIVLAHHIRYLLGGIALIVLGVAAFVFANHRSKSTPPAS